MMPTEQDVQDSLRKVQDLLRESTGLPPSEIQSRLATSQAERNAVNEAILEGERGGRLTLDRVDGNLLVRAAS